VQQNLPVRAAVLQGMNRSVARAVDRDRLAGKGDARDHSGAQIAGAGHGIPVIRSDAGPAQIA